MREEEKALMRGAEFIGKNVVNLYDGVRICTIQNIDFVFDGASGEIQALDIPLRKGRMFHSKKMIQIPWDAVQKIGKEVIIVDIGKLS